VHFLIAHKETVLFNYYNKFMPFHTSFCTLYKMWPRDSGTVLILLFWERSIQYNTDTKWNNKNKINVFLVTWKRPTHHRCNASEVNGIGEQHLCILSVWSLGRQWQIPTTSENLIWEWNGHIKRVHVIDFQMSKTMHTVINHWECILYCQRLPSMIISIMAKDKL
jgi:hypothetical protein